MHRRIYIGEKLLHYYQCPKILSRAHHLKNHRRTQTGEREKPFPCDQCTNYFSEAGSLKNHRSTPTREKPFPCDQGSKTFSETGSFKKHRTHTGDKTFHCPKILSSTHHLKKS